MGQGVGADGEWSDISGTLDVAGRLSAPLPDAALAHRAAFSLALTRPACSAASLFAPQRPGIVRPLSVIAGLAGLGAPELFLGLLAAAGVVFFTSALGFRIWLYVRGWQPVQANPAPAAEPREWPVYTLLIALKDEADSAAQLASAITGLDYPQGRFDVKLLIETGDNATRHALIAERWPAGTELLVVPPGMPRTQPRALNYGLARARGEFVVVYDAEDRPYPDQLKASVRAFRSEGGLACVQVPLVGEGARGWIAGQWALEHAVQFGRLLPGLVARGCRSCSAARAIISGAACCRHQGHGTPGMSPKTLTLACVLRGLATVSA